MSLYNNTINGNNTNVEEVKEILYNIEDELPYTSDLGRLRFYDLRAISARYTGFGTVPKGVKKGDLFIWITVNLEYTGVGSWGNENIIKHERADELKYCEKIFSIIESHLSNYKCRIEICGARSY